MIIHICHLFSPRTLLEGGLTKSSHKAKFMSLLLIEEIQMEVDIRKYDMKNVTMTVCRDNSRLLTLKVQYSKQIQI